MRSDRNGNAHPYLIADIMQTLDAVSRPLDECVEEIARVVFASGTVIYPTETTYVIGCDPFDSAAIDHLYGVKRRPDAKPLTFHVASVEELLEYAGGNPFATLAARRLLPAAVVLLVRRPQFIDGEVTAGLPTLGLRVPHTPIATAILARCGPLAATSANISGERAYRGIGDTNELPSADLLVSAGPTGSDAEPSIVDISGSHPLLIREGAVSAERLRETFGELHFVAPKIRGSQ